MGLWHLRAEVILLAAGRDGMGSIGRTMWKSWEMGIKDCDNVGFFSDVNVGYKLFVYHKP